PAAVERDLPGHLRRRFRLVHRQVHGIGEDDFAGFRPRFRLQRELHRLPVHVAARAPDLALAERDADLDPVAGQGAGVPGSEAILHRHGAEDRVGGREEGGDERVPQTLHLVPVVSADHRQQQGVVEREHPRVLLARLPAGALGEALHVREQQDEVLLRALHGSAPSRASAKNAVATAIIAARPAPMNTSPGPATASMREAMFTGSPKTSPPVIRTSPRWTATLAWSWRSGGTDASKRRTRSISAAAQSTALVGESKATRNVPPICLT